MLAYRGSGWLLKERRLRAKERQQLDREGKTLKKTSPAGETLKREDNRVRHS